MLSRQLRDMEAYLLHSSNSCCSSSLRGWRCQVIWGRLHEQALPPLSPLACSHRQRINCCVDVGCLHGSIIPSLCSDLQHCANYSAADMDALRCCDASLP